MVKTVLFLQNPSKFEKETIKFLEDKIKNMYFSIILLFPTEYAFDRTVDNAVPTVQYTGSSANEISL